MSFIGEAAVSAFLRSLFGKLKSSELIKVATNKQVRKEIEKWSQTLRIIDAVLADAEEKQMQNKAVKVWLQDLKDLAYDVDDILDEFATEALKLIKQQHHLKIGRFLALGTTFHPTTLMFNHKMMSKMKDITEKLDALDATKGKLQLRENANAERMIPKRPESSSLVNEDEVYGREEDRQKILDLLIGNDGSDGGGSVIPIVGMGGIGKITLAQLVYNDDSIKDHFDLKAWVCVSDEFDFDIKRITKLVLLSVTSQPCDHLIDLNSLQGKLQEKLSKKKFLLVLDDVWNENYDNWMNLRRPFEAGHPGSKIIVTTRSTAVSSIMRWPTLSSDHLLQKLPYVDSLRLFAHHALGASDFGGYPNLEKIGLKIMENCDGLPLATKTVGGLLRTKLNPKAWNDILKSEIWDSLNNKSPITPALWLSYYHLPSQLKECFAYCSLVPKDYEFEREEMVLLWMAEGFLHQPNTEMPSADFGSKCFEELVSRSFFQVSSMNKSKFVMHDLINDLAQSVAGEFFFRMEGHGQMKFSWRTRHTSFTIGRIDRLQKFETFLEAKYLRTFLPFMMMCDQFCYLSNEVVTDLVPKLRHLRVLSLERYQITLIPNSIANLIHLRYLNFSYTIIKGLPDSICNLYNLETLLLRGYWKVEKLPSEIGSLVKLCHLDIKGANLILEMPGGIGKLTNLRALSNFIVDREDGLKEMQNLSNLKGEISISYLQNVDEAQAACVAASFGKLELDILELMWCADFNPNSRKVEIERKVLSLLQPHNDLQVFTIKYYGGTLLPTWIGDPLFKNLQSLKFEKCQNCTVLPTVGKLPLLKDLYIKGMSSVVCVGNEFYGESWQNVFPSLETLHFEDMPEWKEWKPCGVDEHGKKFPRLRKLCISYCPKLVAALLDGLHSLENLEIHGCQELVLTISDLQMLSKLEIGRCKEVVVGSSFELWSVKQIHLSSISKFSCVREEAMMSKSVKVEKLQIDGSEELASLWQTKWLWSLRSLRTIDFGECRQVVCIGAATKEEEKTEGVLQLEIPCNIEYVTMGQCEGFEKLSTTFSNLRCLKMLHIVKCTQLVSISLDNLPSTLRTLNIRECVNFQSLVDDGDDINFNRKCSLESLTVVECRRLKSLSASGKLPSALKRLEIQQCRSLEVIAVEFGDDMCLEEIRVLYCINIKYLPQGLDKLRRLQKIGIYDCPNIVCFPKSGLPATPNFKSLTLCDCEKLEALPKPSLHSLQLEELEIKRCPNMKVKSMAMLTTLSSLKLEDEPNISKAVMEWGELHTLTSLTHLTMDGRYCTDTVSFPQSLSLIDLRIRNFKNLRKLSLSSNSNGFQNLTSLQCLSISNCLNLKSLPKNLTSLQRLSIENCPKLKSLPKKEMLPSLLELYISNCRELTKLCKKDNNNSNKRKLWSYSYISHIPRVIIDGRLMGS